MKHNYNQNSIRCLRYIPVISFLLMFAHVILLQLGIDLRIAEIGVVVMGYIIAYRFSMTCGFCLMHRMMIYYAFTMMTCIWLRRLPDGEYGLFGHYIVIARVFMFVWGMVIFTMLVHRKFRNK